MLESNALPRRRARYFHNGFATALLDVVHFYETRFGLTLTPQQESDLVAFFELALGLKAY